MKKAFVYILTLVVWSVCTPAMADQYFNRLLKSQDGEMKYKMATDMRKALSGVGANLKKAIGKKNKKAKPTKRI